VVLVNCELSAVHGTASHDLGNTLKSTLKSGSYCPILTGWVCMEGSSYVCMCGTHDLLQYLPKSSKSRARIQDPICAFVETVKRKNSEEA